MTTVADSVSWDTHEDELKSYLGVSGSAEDTRLESLLRLAVAQADLFIDGDLEDYDDAPQLVVDGVFEFVRLTREEDELAARTAGTTSVKTRDLQENYAALSQPVIEDILRQVGSYWWPYKLEILP